LPCLKIGLIKRIWNFDILVDYHKSKMFIFKKPGQFHQVLGRIEIAGSHKRRENHPTLVVLFKHA